mmetsp:Transcript_28799/g.81243  ORF Transcript_28799/g.81243 Transcript_28799/m.81243 type:complete len:490 (-) Transcript_28799:185-1654(-)|eukprot:CAMPEP_0119568962 /NCGR_PEP_ID=MMETSP1352-20130426/40314_1 /TAXON_ID=265584 /ORGANISM="Stauroneis constricta, Strain CCMP1120" /LENGTH=489 /DNA_ID=CAMNT_0007618437 /DNA_START=147 /DNA_END=1616 /DNA_ORIENTATION=+
MLLRVRSNVGVWRVDGLDDKAATIQTVLDEIKEVRPHVEYSDPGICQDPACKSPLDVGKTLAELGLRHGSMVYCRVDPASCAERKSADAAAAGDGDAMDTSTSATPAAAAAAPEVTSTTTTTNMKRIIDKDGSIKMVPTSDPIAPKDDRGFRKGKMALRDMKMAWTLNEFMALDAQYTFKIQRQEEAVCSQVSLDTAAVGDFQSYAQRFAFSRNMMGFLYGRFEEDKDSGKKKTIVEAIYEPPQQIDKESVEGFALLDDPLEETVDKIAEMCGMKKVGWILGHEPRGDDKEGMFLTSAEIQLAAEFQLEAAEGVEETPFCMVRVTRGSDGNVTADAFQVSQQCMAMVAEEALEVDGADLKSFKVNETFTAIQEGKESKTIDNNFFLCVVPIVQHTSEVFVSQFPKLNRELDDRTPSHDELKRQLSKSGSSGWTFIDLLSDFNLLIYLSKSLDVNADMPKITQSVVNRDIPLDDGYKIIIASMAGIDNAY